MMLTDPIYRPYLPHEPEEFKSDTEWIFSLLTHTKQLSLKKFCDTTAGIGAEFWTHTDGTTDGQTEVEVETVF